MNIFVNESFWRKGAGSGEIVGIGLWGWVIEEGVVVGEAVFVFIFSLGV